MDKQQLFIIQILAVVLAILLAVVSIFGIFIGSTYSREVASMAAQGAGQDIVDLFIVIPVLLVSLFFMQHGNKPATFIFGGTVLYILYSFVIYSFGVHFNNLFLLYCLILGCSLYLFILYISSVNKMEIFRWFQVRIPAKSVGIYFLVIAAMFYLLWLKDIIPAISNNTVPQSVSDYDLLVNPVHVLDIAVMLPGLIITAVLIMKKNKLGYLLTPVLLVFTILLTIALAAMVISLRVNEVSGDSSVAGVFIILAVISTALLGLFLSRMKSSVA